MQARLPDGRIFEATPGTPVGDVLEAAAQDGHRGWAVAAFIGGRLRELQTPLTADCDVAPVTLADSDGTRIYRRSLSLLLITAASELFPDASVFIEHSAPTLGAYYCRVRGRERVHDRRSSRQSSGGCARSWPPTSRSGRRSVTRAEAIAIFEQRHETDKARLLAHRDRETIALYELRARVDYFQGFMLPATGRLRRFALHPLAPGFLLQYPHQASPTELTPFEPYPRLFAAFAEAGEWLDRLGIRSTGALNDAIAEERLPEVSLVAEALHEARIARIAADIARRESVRVVMIAGPSSSGKTTFAKRLAVQLLVNGRRPFAVDARRLFPRSRVDAARRDAVSSTSSRSRRSTCR